jgi:DNA transposition AAA+ family ATPase
MPDDKRDQPDLNVVGDAAETAFRDVNPIDQAVSMEARHMLKSLELPADGALSPDLRSDVRKAVKKHIKSYRITYRTVGTSIGVGDSTISEVLQGKYKGNADAILRKLNAWIDDDERRRSKSKPLGFYETSVFKSIRDLARIAKRNAITEKRRVIGDDKPRIVIGYGPPGCGKTLGIEALCAEDTNALSIRVRTNGGTGNAIARAVLDAAGFRGRPQNVGNLDYVIEKLRYSGRLLIVDEAHKLRESGFEVLRDLADDAGIPIMLLGTDRTHRKVERSRRGMDQMDDQFSRRVGLVIDLLRGSDGEGGSKRPIFSISEVRAIFSDDTVRMSDDGLELLCAVANTIGIGMLGMAVNIYEKAQYAARRRPNNEINADLLWKACERVLLPAGFEFSRQADPIKQQIAASLDRVRELKRAAG